MTIGEFISNSEKYKKNFRNSSLLKKKVKVSKIKYGVWHLFVEPLFVF